MPCPILHRSRLVQGQLDQANGVWKVFLPRKVKIAISVSPLAYNSAKANSQCLRGNTGHGVSVVEVFLDQQLLGIKKQLVEAGFKVHDDSEIRGNNDTRIGIPDEVLLEFLSAHRDLHFVTKDRGLAGRAFEMRLMVTFVDETEMTAVEVIRRLMLSFEEIQWRFDSALRRFLHNDAQLLVVNANERSMTHKLAEYLQQEFQGWNVDCEYNRNRADVKKLPLPRRRINWDDLEGRTVFPDIIVHHRTMSDNLLVVEAKKSSSAINDAFDLGKLEQFKEDPFHYRYGLFIKFYVGDKSKTPPYLRWV